MARRKSSFTRLIWTITLLSTLVLTIIGAVVIGSIVKQTTLQTVSFLSQQITALGDAYQLQIQNLVFLRERMYEVNTGMAERIYDSMTQIIHDNSVSFESGAHYAEYIDHAANLFVFLNLVQNAAEFPPKQITISSETWGEKHFIWPMFSLYALDFARYVSRLIPQPGLNPGAVGILPWVMVTGRPGEGGHYVLYSYLAEKPDSDVVDGTIAYSYELQNLNHVLQRSSKPFTGSAYILQPDGRIVYDSDAKLQGQLWPEFEALAASTQPYVERDGKLHVLVPLEGQSLWALAVLDGAQLQAQIMGYVRLIVGVILALGAFLFGSTRWAIRRLSHRVDSLQQVMQVAQTGNLDVRADDQQSDEIGTLARGCNDMIEKIQQYIQERYVSEIRQKNADIQLREAALRALQAQIDPHFLYNTLETIRMQAIVNEDRETAMLIEMLAQLFRARLEDGHVTTLRKEMVTLGSLIEIMAARFNGELVVQTQLPPELNEAAVLKDLIQPIVENAFVHGLYLCPDDMRKQLDIRVAAGGPLLTIDVTNSHPSESVDLSRVLEKRDAAPQPGQRRKQVGLRNVHERIVMVYGEPFGVSVQEARPYRVCVRLTLANVTTEQLQAMARGEEADVPRVAGG
ncbi:MAG TPA: histidine kinase [Clostridia bacterium]|nr:histidine kinase [Clostridia bacterium]